MVVDVSGLKNYSMKLHWRKLISLLPLSGQKKIFKKHFLKLHKKWVDNSQPLPPSHLSKQLHLRKWAQKNNLKTLVETGTYFGDMVFAMQGDFKKIISIELAEIFYKKARKRFERQEHVQILHGDSGKRLQEVMSACSEEYLIWLDGHYSGGLTAKGEKECPVFEELEHIFASPYNHTILIDDARLFIGKNDYPSIDDLKLFVLERKPDYHFFLDNDAIVITPN